MSTHKDQSDTNITISQQTFNEYQQLKHIVSQLVGKDSITDDDFVGSLIEGFMTSYMNGQKQDSHGHGKGHGKSGCCGGGCCS